MHNTNKIKLTLIAIVLAILITVVLKYLLVVMLSQFGLEFYKPLTATIYVGAYFGLHFYVDRAVQAGQYAWLRKEDGAS